jgi:nucleoside-diphosphate-sugar epimerase
MDGGEHMKVLVTGASGFVGSAIVRELVSQGHEVAGLVRSPSRAAAVEDIGAKPVVGNLFEPDSWQGAVRESDIVISATRPVRHGSRLNVEDAHRRSYNHGRMVGNILNAAQGSRVKCVALTYGVQGMGDRDRDWVDEHTELRPAGYEHTVSGAFWHIDKTSRKTRVPIINIFTGWPYGEGGWLVETARDLQRGAFRMVGGGSNYLSLIHIDDLAAAYARIVEKLPAGNRFCLVDGAPVRQRELVGLIAECVGAPAPKKADFASHSARAGELLAQSWCCSTRVSGEKMKQRLLPTLKYPSAYEGVPAALEAAGLLVNDPVQLKKASGF